MKSIEECLDIILEQLVKDWDRPDGGRSFLKAEELLRQFDLPSTMQKHEFFKRLILRLIDDGNAETTTGQVLNKSLEMVYFQEYVLITIEGYYFITEKNGYTKQRELNETALTIKD